ncbi:MULTISPECIES: glycoside hydrolase family 38 C-terminal domain-containing protein [unclassified Streptomyces]|uniref:glycoside hydrolase family 38 N-terminal domain-containing protein n=1 Tax=unclassified Streptomyces TaxID=2593676 RepID=UPI000CD51C87|nr:MULTISPECIES: glycoside hydrolase family 38 C-terminal domain-containing protein [unclassified Streptomyces]
MRDLVIVPHTHWDREWYLPFQRFRLQLVGLLDELLETMENDERHRFTLDGQLAAVDDYLEVRPEARERVVELVKAGRLAIGPWDILMDEFLCSGEQIVRNLERGIRRSEELGGVMPVGYLPDMFGHIAQMPQILSRAGLHHACVNRGVPTSVTTDSFAWTSPDGTAVRTRYLAAGGYGNAAGLLADPDSDAERVTELAKRMAPWTLPGSGPLLGMLGSDHTAPVPEAPDRLAAATAETGITTRLETLAAFFAELPDTPEGLPAVHGELRSHARTNLLPGVNSVRPQLKQAMSHAERAVERYAEPLAALFGDGTEQRFLDMAWQRLIAVSGHDSVTGCGCDETAVQVGARMAEAEQLGQAVCDMIGRRLAAEVPQDAVLVFNPSPFPRSGVVFAKAERPGGTVLADDRIAGAVALARVHGTELYGKHITAWELDGDTLTFQVARHTTLAFDVAEVRDALAARDERWQHTELRVRIVALPEETVPVWVDVPALGHTAVRPPEAGTVAELPPHDVRAGGRALDNGLLRVEVAADGTLTLIGADGVRTTGVGALEDGGDLGDTYNYAPPAADVLVREPEQVRVTAGPASPLAASYTVERDYHWPMAGDFATGGRSARTEPVTVTTRVELRAAEKFVRVSVEFDNRCDDHRLRMRMPLPRRAESSFAEGQFAVVERGLSAEGGGGEQPVSTFPAAGFVAAGGLAVLLEEYSEYELTEDGGELALTLLRSVGYLSRNRHVNRDEPAGPQVPTPGAQVRGLRTVSLALAPYADGWQDGDVLRSAEEFRHGLYTLEGRGPRGDKLPEPTHGLAVTGEGVALTAVRQREEWTEVRVVAEGGADTEARVEGGFTRARRADLLGRPGEELTVTDGVLTLPVGAWEIATVQLGR